MKIIGENFDYSDADGNKFEGVTYLPEWVSSFLFLISFEIQKCKERKSASCYCVPGFPWNYWVWEGKRSSASRGNTDKTEKSIRSICSSDTLLLSLMSMVKAWDQPRERMLLRQWVHLCQIASESWSQGCSLLSTLWKRSLKWTHPDWQLSDTASEDCVSWILLVIMRILRPLFPSMVLWNQCLTCHWNQLWAPASRFITETPTSTLPKIKSTGSTRRCVLVMPTSCSVPMPKLFTPSQSQKPTASTLRESDTTRMLRRDRGRPLSVSLKKFSRDKSNVSLCLFSRSYQCLHHKVIDFFWLQTISAVKYPQVTIFCDYYLMAQLWEKWQSDLYINNDERGKTYMACSEESCSRIGKHRTIGSRVWCQCW